MQITILLMQSCSFLLKSFKIIKAKLEVRLGYAIFPAAKFFTDDIVISSTCKDQLSALISSFYDGLDIKFLASKNFMMTNAQMLIGWIVDDATIEEVLEAEYLGVQNEVDWCIRVPSATWLVFFCMGEELLLVRIRIMINQANLNCAVVMKLWNPMILDGMTLKKPRKFWGTLSEICTSTNFQRKKDRILAHFVFQSLNKRPWRLCPSQSGGSRSRRISSIRRSEEYYAAFVEAKPFWETDLKSDMGIKMLRLSAISVLP